MFILDLGDICNDLAFLRTIKFIKNLLEVIRILVPIILIITCIIDFCKALFAGEDKQITSTMIKRFMSAIIIFFIVPVVNMFFELLGESQVDASECWNNANDSNIEALAKVEEEKMNSKREEEKLKQEAALAAKNQEIENAKNNAIQNSSNTSSGANSPSVSSNIEGYIYYNQGDYSQTPFCGSGKTVQSSGCSAASFAIVASNLVNSSYNPVEVASWLCSNIHDGGALAASKLLNSQLLNKFGLNGEKLLDDIGTNNIDIAKNQIVNALNQNKMIILYIPGHYVVLAKGSNNNIVWLDPGKRANNGTYTIDQIWEKTKNYKSRCSLNGNCGWHGAYAYTKK